jgi:CheY-like chemotaxis protein
MPTILIVDDRRDAIEILQSKLQQKGFVTESTQDAREIAGICERQQIDLIIMDMNMPELDGCEATSLLKAEEATSKIPVIICTAQPILNLHTCLSNRTLPQPIRETSSRSSTK